MKETEEVVEAEQEFKPFNQIPIWKTDSEFIVKGSEFEAIYNLFNIFVPGITALQQVFERSVQSGIVQIKNEYQDGSGEVPAEVLKDYFTKLNELLKEKLPTKD